MTTYNAHVSSLDFAKEKVSSDLKINKNRRLSALFRDIRGRDSVNGIGDWPIMSMMIQTVTRIRPLKKYECYGLCKQSEEYKELSKGSKRLFLKVLIASLNY